MSLNTKSDIGKTVGFIASIATIIGACIAIIALIPAFGQWLNPHEPSAINQPSYTSVTSNASPTPVNTIQRSSATATPSPSESTITPTSIPVEPRIIEQTETYSVIIRSPIAGENSSGLKVRLFVGNQPSVAELTVFNAIKDITDRWVPTRDNNGSGWFGRYGKDMFTKTEPLPLNPGMYVLEDDEVVGKWGNEFLYSEMNGEQHYLTFPIEEGLVTEISLHFALLEIGIKTQSDQPVDGARLTISCLSNEYGLGTGKVDCAEYQHRYAQTNSGGLGSYIIVPGNYAINVYYLGEVNFGLDETVNITSLDSVRVVFTAPIK